MSILNVEHLTHGFGDRAIFNDVSFRLLKGEHIGLIGANGEGKSTFMNIITGKLQPDEGKIEWAKRVRVGYLDQHTVLEKGMTIRDVLASAFNFLYEMETQMNEICDKMGDCTPEELEEYMEELGTIQDLLTMHDFYMIDSKVEEVARALGLTAIGLDKDVSELSGGQRTKIAFLKLLLSKPDLLLLDEPTNHLDIEAVGWLEDYIKNYKKAVLIVSHDRMFLDNTVSEIYEIEHGKTTRYIGNYSNFVIQKRQNRDQQSKDYEAQQKEIARIQATADRFRYKATKAAMAQSKLKSIERMEKIDAPDSYDNRTFKASIEPTVQSAKEVLTVSNLTIGFDTPLATLSFNVYRGNRVGIIGGNGMGKSTLLKTLVGKIPALSGTYSMGALVNTGYFDQQMAQIKGSETVLDNMMSAFPSLTEFEARSALGAFLFSGEAVFKTIDMLSGGERVRLALCKLFRKSPNLLILDEPTNHMDIISKETLEDILLSYSGTLIFVSHDRYFVKKLADRLITFENGSAKVWDFGYDEYMLRNPQEETSPEAPQKTEKKEKKTYTTPLKEKAKRERALKKAEEKIAELEKTLEELKAEQQSPDNLSDYQKLSELQNQIDYCEAQLLEQMELWEELA